MVDVAVVLVELLVVVVLIIKGQNIIITVDDKKW